MKCSNEDNMELFVARVKIRIDRLLDGRKKSKNKHLDLLKYVGYLSNIDITLEIFHKTNIIDTLQLLERNDDQVRRVVGKLLDSWKPILCKNKSGGPVQLSSCPLFEGDIQSQQNDIFPTSFNEQLSEFILPNQQKKVSKNLNSLSEIQPGNIDLNVGSLWPQKEQLPSLPDIVLPDSVIENVNIQIPKKPKLVKRARCPSNSISQFISRNNQRKKLYVGKVVISSLHELCIRKIVSNVQLMSKLPCYNFRFIKPILDRISPQELTRLEVLNQHIIPFTESIWKRNCQKTFKNIFLTKKGESWRNMYNLMQIEKEEKLKSVSCRISAKQSSKKPLNMMKTISLVKSPKTRKFINPNKNERYYINNDAESKKHAPLMKRTIMEFKERKQISKSKPIKFL